VTFAVFCFILLAAACIVGPYAIGVPPRTRRHWICLAVALAFIAWILPMMASLRSR
jgi:hypothetical protein